jgi:predicted alpha/beta superfamily hydrolase
VESEPTFEPPHERYVLRLRVHYPLDRGRLVLRTELDWDRDLEAHQVSADGTCFEFQVESEHPVLAFKPCVRDGDELQWSAGTNKIVTPSDAPGQNVYPHFSDSPGRISDVIELPSGELDHPLRVRVYLPPGYDDNTLKRYPVVYMHDGKNLFFPDEAFLGREWQVDETLDVLSCMNLIDQTIVVGIHAGEREREYTAPGYERYGQALVDELKPYVDRTFRTLRAARRTAVLGSSLGGVVSFYLAWQWPDVFGNAACLSSTFGFRNDLIERVRHDPLDTRRDLKLYLDSGWPGDNYEVTLSMANALIERGFVFGRDMIHFAFPLQRHNEEAWGARMHLPLQLFSGKLRRASERARDLLRASVPPPSRRAPG